MNYDEARPLLDGTGFRWTTTNDGVSRTAWPCHGCVNPHSSAEEAERHYYDASLADVVEIKFGNWHGCRVCDAPTKSGLGNRGDWKLFRPEPLCDAHRNSEELSRIRPFKTGIRVIHS